MIESTTYTMVYRVEHAADDRPGPFTAGILIRARGGLDGGRHPEPSMDGLSPVAGRLFGFPSLDAYGVWFHTARAREILADEGFRLAKYRVPAAAVQTGLSGTQVTFDRLAAVRVADQDPRVEGLQDDTSCADAMDDFWAE